MTLEEAERIALRAFSFLTADDERMNRFLQGTGMRPDMLRIAAESAGFFATLLDYVAADEGLLIAFAEHSAIRPERVVQAGWRLSPGRMD